MDNIKNYVSVYDVDDRFNEGCLSFNHTDNCTIALWYWKGWNIVKYSACVDEKKFSKEIGEDLCIEKIKDELWMLLGYELFLKRIGE